MKKLLLAVVALASVATPLQNAFAQADLFDKMARAKQVEKQNSMNSSEPVSYTHLTLPTSDLV